MLKKLFWTLVLGIAHLIPAKTYKATALDFIRFKRDGKKTENKTAPAETAVDSRFLDHGPSSRRKP